MSKVDLLFNSDRKAFSRRFHLYIALSWLLPPVVGLSFLWFIQMFTPAQMFTILSSPVEITFIFGSLFGALFYYRRLIRPLALFVEQPHEAKRAGVEAVVKKFSRHYWSGFLLYLLLAPATVILSAEAYSDFVSYPADWFRIHLVALIVSIIVGLPIFFRLFDHFGKYLAPHLEFREPQLTIRTKVFLIGALMPLLMVIILLQYFWSRTEEFAFEMFGVGLSLAVMAVIASLIFVRSFGQSLRPLEKIISWSTVPFLDVRNDLIARSTDELGRLSHRYRDVFSRLDKQKELLSIRNQILRVNSEISDVAEVYQKIISVTESIVGTDATFIFRFDPVSYELVCIACSEMPFDWSGHFRLPLDEKSFAQILFHSRVPIAVDDALSDKRISARMVEEFMTVSAIGAPLMVNDEGLGVLISINRNQVRHYESFDVSIIEAVAKELATILKTQTLETQRNRAETQLQRSNERAAVTLQAIGDGVISTDATGHIEFMNAVAEKLAGVSIGAVKGEVFAEVVQLLDGDSGEKLTNPVERSLLDGEAYTVPGAICLKNRATGEESAVEVRVSPIVGEDSQVDGAVVVFHNVTELRLLSSKLVHQSLHDELTGVLNRRAFKLRLKEMLDHAQLNEEQHTFCYLDLDQFKLVNDAHGHAAGDALLRQLSELLKSRLRKTDVLARLGGDGFGLLLEGYPLDKGREFIEQLLTDVAQFQFRWNGVPYNITVSAGLVVIDNESAGITDLLSEAHSACMAAKKLGRNRLHVYQLSDSILVQHKHELRWSQLIKNALNEERFVLYMQPIQRLSTGDKGLAGEILVRMLGDSGQIIMPNDFIPAAECYHLMPAVDRLVVKHAFRSLQCVSDRQYAYSINLSSQSLCDDEFLNYVLEAMNKYQVQPGTICFEITESVAISNPERARNFIHTLKQKGCLFALDDFGSGLSSFSYLKHLPVDYLKIDGSFVRDMDSNNIDCAMVEAVNNVAHMMGIETVAEYIVNQSVFEQVESMGIDYGQGFHLSEPVPLSSDALIA